MLTFHIVTLFPEMFGSYLTKSILGRAEEDKKIAYRFYNPRDFMKKEEGRADGRPYGGGPGMVMKALPVIRAASAARKKIPKGVRVKTIIFSPAGKLFTANMAKRLAKQGHVILIAGRYEGIDARVKKILHAEEISVGPYMLTGGELPAMAVIDATARHVSGVLGSPESLEETRAASHEVYTRPEAFTYKSRTYKVPKILLTGHHGHIENWRKIRGA